MNYVYFILVYLLPIIFFCHRAIEVHFPRCLLPPQKFVNAISFGWIIFRFLCCHLSHDLIIFSKECIEKNSRGSLKIDMVGEGIFLLNMMSECN